MRKRVSRKAALAAMRIENERAELEMIRRWLALPMERRTNFLRLRIPAKLEFGSLQIRGSAL